MPIHADRNEKQRILQESLLSLVGLRSEKLAQSNKDFYDLREKLNGVYKDGFRHSYAGLFPIISEAISGETFAEENMLQRNLSDFYDFLISEGDESLAKSIYKLIDHVELEVSRFAYLTSGPESRIEDLNRQLDKNTERLSQDLNGIQGQMDNVAGQATGIQTQIVAILGIFSAIVITFSGGMSFVGNVLAGMAETPTLKAISIVSVCGLVVANTVFLLMYFVSKLTGRNIYATCETPDCTCDPLCGSLTRLRKRLPYVFWLNVLLIFLAALPLFCDRFVLPTKHSSDSSALAAEKNIKVQSADKSHQSTEIVPSQ